MPRKTDKIQIYYFAPDVLASAKFENKSDAKIIRVLPVSFLSFSFFYNPSILYHSEIDSIFVSAHLGVHRDAFVRSDTSQHARLYRMPVRYFFQ